MAAISPKMPSCGFRPLDRGSDWLYRNVSRVIPLAAAIFFIGKVIYDLSKGKITLSYPLLAAGSMGVGLLHRLGLKRAPYQLFRNYTRSQHTQIEKLLEKGFKPDFETFYIAFQKALKFDADTVLDLYPKTGLAMKMISYAVKFGYLEHKSSTGETLLNLALRHDYIGAGQEIIKLLGSNKWKNFYTHHIESNLKTPLEYAVSDFLDCSNDNREAVFSNVFYLLTQLEKEQLSLIKPSRVLGDDNQVVVCSEPVFLSIFRSLIEPKGANAEHLNQIRRLRRYLISKLTGQDLAYQNPVDGNSILHLLATRPLDNYASVQNLLDTTLGVQQASIFNKKNESPLYLAIKAVRNDLNSLEKMNYAKIIASKSGSRVFIRKTQEGTSCFDLINNSGNAELLSLKTRFKKSVNDQALTLHAIMALYHPRPSNEATDPDKESLNAHAVRSFGRNRLFDPHLMGEIVDFLVEKND